MARRIVFLAFLMLAEARVAHAQTVFVWNALGSDHDITTAGNWQGGVAPSGNPSDVLTFGSAPFERPQVSTDLTVGSISFTGFANFYFFDAAPATSPTITVAGGITSATGSNPFAVFGPAILLTAGSHNITTDGSDIYLWGGVTGSGGIVKNGISTLILSSGPGQPGSNDYAGGTVINAGRVMVGRDHDLGTGAVTMNGGTLLPGYTTAGGPTIVLQNDFLLGASVVFGSADKDAVPLQIGNGVNGTTIAPTASTSTVTFHLDGSLPLTLAGNMIDGGTPTQYVFAGDGPLNKYFLAGTNTYTGGTLVNSGASIIFTNGSALPSAGVIGGPSGSYVGLFDASVSASSYVGHFDSANFSGTVGFDTDPVVSGPTVFNGTIDLTGFAATGISLGTSSSATLTGAIAVQPGASYNFNGSGTLFLADPDLSTSFPLVGGGNIEIDSLTHKPPLLVVNSRSGQSSVAGDVYVNHGGLIFDTAGSVPNSSDLVIQAGGYVGITDNSGLSLDEVISELSPVPNGIIGFDRHNYLYGVDALPVTYSSPIDLSVVSVPIFLGSATNTILTGAISTTNGNNDPYQFTGFNGGSLTVQSNLSGPRGVIVGAPVDYQDFWHGIYSTVTLDNPANSYSGGTTINSGLLVVPDPRSLGSGNITVAATTPSDGRAGFRGTGNFSQNFDIQTGLFVVESGGSLTLSGNITGGGSLESQANFTLSGHNDYQGGSFFSNGNIVTATTDDALGTGPIALDTGAWIKFTSNNPVIGTIDRGIVLPGTDGPDLQAALILAGPGTTTLTINQGYDAQFDGAIVQAPGTTGSVIKTGTGSLRILGNLNSGDTPYSGGTTIKQGKLIVGSPTALGTGTITLDGGTVAADDNVALINPIAFGAGGGTLSGNGTFASNIAVGPGVILAPGNSPGTLTFSSGLGLNSGGELDFQVQFAAGPAGSGYDLVNVSGGGLVIAATSASPFSIRLLSLAPDGTAGAVGDFSSSNSYSWMIFDGNTASGITGFAANKFTLDTSGFSNNLNGGAFSLQQGLDGNGNPAIFLNFAAIPEPSTYALLATGLAALGLARARRAAARS